MFYMRRWQAFVRFVIRHTRVRRKIVSTKVVFMFKPPSDKLDDPLELLALVARFPFSRSSHLLAGFIEIPAKDFLAQNRTPRLIPDENLN
jgi:hypothetical protein